MRKDFCLAGIIAVILALVFGAQAQPLTINGAGASFPYPIYSQWAYKYHRLTGVKINYQSIGSGAGIAQIKAKTVDFGASDAPLTAEELQRAGLIQFPMVIGGVVPVINLEGVGPGQLRLTPQVLADIFLGKIAKWNDPAIPALNPGLRLPDKKITVVHRADGSGTTWLFTHFLSHKSREWREKVGTGKSVRWPAPGSVGGKGNEGVASYVKRVQGAIGYVEYAYALQNEMSYALLQNRAGRFVAPNLETFQAAAANADWQKAPGFYLVLNDQPGEKSWPITGATYILIHKEQPDAAKAEAMLKFFHWCYKHGVEMAEKLGYVPLPREVVTLVEDVWAREVKVRGKPVWP
ncbi:MAG: phosphate ABC transporter substrate-binding protein PstS [Deltaproteobacteria bacterium]|nr:phosphate ABC transporter substrate-binding protein PstS [Deltaproteobacteria bacterium]